MNLSLALLILSTMVAYLIYDIFKKSRQEQQIANVQNVQQEQSGKLKPSYTAECGILKCLHQEKMNSLKHKSISIHLLEETKENGELSPEGKEKVREVIQVISKTHKLYLVVCKRANITNPLLKYLRELKMTEIGYQSIEGAVAVLRQLNCSIHLESEIGLYKTLMQYLSNIWVADAEKTGENLVNQYKNQWDMINSLQQISQIYNKQKDQ